ncbi:hypothetical protein RHP75_08435 [Pseudomonas sp. SG20056]|uniref:hypothetical protein n=1 Tax=Pseudomonas sp. SG20056 TaxID=3074146 RepID=UPI00287F9BF1|nr:hypothetical protein [Pseudomonas sp. SG20056]WNF48425.1 hypothetical protein RHP75_08435 [Pseudomonas sp. SG20056]
MTTLYILFVTYFVSPITLALALGYARENHYLTTDLRITNRTYQTPATHILAVLICLSLYITFILAGYSLSGGKISTSLITVVFIMQCGSTLALTAIIFRATSIYKSSPTSFNIIAGLITAAILFISNIYADAHITSTIKIISSELPAAQKALTLMLFPIIWSFLLIIISTGLYLLSAALILLAGTLKTSSRRAIKNNQLMLSKDNIKVSRHEDNEMVYLAMFVGLAFTTVSIIKANELIVKSEKFTIFTNELIVFASFHFSEIDCLPELKKPNRLALISNDRIVVATPDEKAGYTFRVEKCGINATQ